MFVPACRRPHPNFWNGKTLNYPANIACEKLVLEELDLDPINCSFDGLSGIFSNRHIYYLDKYFGYMYKFDEQGRFLKRSLGVGRGPMETSIKHFVGHAFSNDKELALYGADADFELFDSISTVKKRFIVALNPNNTKTDRFDTYSYAWDNMMCRMYGHILYLGMQSECPTFNYLDQTNAFLQDGYHIGRIDLETMNHYRCF